LPIVIKNDKHGEISVGSVLTCTKIYTDGEVREFFELAGKPADPLPDHLPYLMVIAPLTKLGGDLSYLSGGMDWTVERPVRRDEALRAELEVTHLEPGDGMTKIAFDGRIRCGDELVLTGRSKGFVVGDQAGKSP
jgi:hypothetical protein